MRRFACAVALVLTAAFAPVAGSQQPAGATGPAFVDITWMSISNVMYELGTFGVLTDGYISRIPQSAFFGGGGGLAQTRQAYVSDVAAVKRVLMAIGGPSRIALLLTGHSHFDHSFDTATWSKLTNAPIIGQTHHLPAGAGGGSAAEPMPRRVRRRAHRHHGRRLDACDPLESQRRFLDQS